MSMECMPELRHSPDGDYLPAAGKAWLLPLYDPLSLLFGVRRLHRALLDQAAPVAGQRVLEIGCGTGNVLRELVRRTPRGLDLAGIDPDPDALRRARRKADRAGAGVDYRQGYAGDLPFGDASVDIVLSSLMLHHLDEPGRDQALREAWRVLRPGGRLHVVDIDGHGRSTDLQPHTFTGAGFAEATETGSGRRRRLGAYRFFRAVKQAHP
jgi:ubiquinone/menaquinone biosynthesis C-methylase UbiE